MQLQNYINNLNRLFQTRNAREHSYRGDLQELLNQIINDDDIIVTNEPARICDVGAPDYSITKKDIPLGYIEAKDINKALDSKEYKEQFDRYKNALDNLIITDYLDFWFYKNGVLIQKIKIAKIEDDKIIAIEDSFKSFTNAIKDFVSFISQTITSASRLAKLMAGKARLLEDVIEKAILSDEESNANNSLKEQLEVFKQNIIHDITPSSFADIYAQTIAYGLFTARLHDKTLQDFSRQEAQYLIPKSNPFLRGLFNYIGGVECDDRLIWIIDSLAEIFLATNIEKLFVSYTAQAGRTDPVIHFYETFLGEYNPKLRKARGVWYTPTSVVDFIVRAVDEVLKDEFDLEDGLIDDSKIKIKIESPSTLYNKNGTPKKDQTIEKEVHKVQVLDPATGTGTFLAQTIKFIKKEFWGGSWSAYVENDLIPRLNGFELLMASYAMAHLKLDLLLMETGYKPTSEQNQKRLNVYLTNSLESYHEHTGNLFSSYLANESKQADRIKKETPVMVVMGNPPYAVSSSNKGEWIQHLLKDYKKDLNERKINLDDDYIKFIRYGQHFIDKNGEGILAYISNNSFIDGITHRQMRKHLLESFDKIYILDLHGNSKKKEVCLDGSKDENVFDIMQGVSINIFMKKKSNSKKLADVYHYDLYGKRDFKYDFLDENNLNNITWKKLKYKEPNYFFVYKDFSLQKKWDNGFKIDELFTLYNSGISTDRDLLFIDCEKEKLINKFSILLSDKIDDNFKIKYRVENSSSYKIIEKITNKIFDEKYISKIQYRMLDIRYIYYDTSIVSRSAKQVMKHFFQKDNFGIILNRQYTGTVYSHCSLSKYISNKGVHYLGNTGNDYNFPLYLYQEENSLDNTRVPNLNLEIVADIEKTLNLKFVNEKEQDKTTFAPIDILDYIYAVLHSPNYRQMYKEFLKIDFPRVPYPNAENFWQLIAFGSSLRSLHLLEDKSLDERIIDIKGDGDMTITNKLNKKDFTITDDKVELRLNENISIVNIPLISWEFFIGGYQPAQKWLKDRVGRELSRNDLKHYNKIINTLKKTDEIMKKIDGVLVLDDGK